MITELVSRAPFVSPPAANAAVSSGPSPTTPGISTVHLLGAGRVGQALLRRWSSATPRLVAVSDRSGTLYARAGLDARSLAEWKVAGKPFADHPCAAGLPLDVALSVANASIVIDATDSNLDPVARESSARRALTLLQRGKRLLLAAKTPLLLPAATLREYREQLGVAAVFGGSGSAWLADVGDQRHDFDGFACVPNATTTLLIGWLEQGGTLSEGLVQARAAGLLEADPAQDLDGRDAALKLTLAARLAFGRNLELDAIERPDLTAIEPSLLRARHARGATTRLVGRIARDGKVTLRYEEVLLGDPLAVPSQCVVYLWQRADGSARVHIGRGLGPEGTATALLTDLRAAVSATTASTIAESPTAASSATTHAADERVAA